MTKLNITALQDDWIVYLNSRSANPMDKASKATQRRARELAATIEYCSVCFVKLNDATGIAVLRPLVDTGERSSIPLADRRVTMCSKHAADALEAKTHATADRV